MARGGGKNKNANRSSKPRDSSAVFSNQLTPVPPTASNRRACQSTGGPSRQPRNLRRRKNQSAKAVQMREREMLPCADILPYGPVESKQRLLRTGFHPDVTDSTPEEVVVAWLLMAHFLNQRPSRDEYTEWDDNYYLNQGYYTYSRHVLELWLDPEGDVYEKGNGKIDLRQEILGVTLVTQVMAEEVFADGFNTIQALAVAWPEAWLGMAKETTIYDFVAQKCRNECGKVFLAICPEYTLQDARLHLSAEALNDDKWAESKSLKNLVDAHQATGTAPPFWGATKRDPTVAQKLYSFFFSDSIVQKVRSLPYVGDLEASGQSSSAEDLQPYNISNHRGLARLRHLLEAISRRSEQTEVLHLQKIPFLDRRVLAIILRGCPRLTMIGVYDCPMIHFGDVICILDLIYEVNQERKKAGHPLIRAFDFYPRYEAGMPYAHGRAATYGITWGPHRRDVVNRGFYRIILEAFLKASEMGIDLLFTKGKAFREFLFRVPFLPLGVPSFLDGLYRYLDLVKSGSTDENAKNQAIYDLLKAVRLGTEDIRNDWPYWYSFTMSKHLHFCASCGNNMLEAFYTTNGRGMMPHCRICTGCTLRRYIDGEADHHKQEKKRCLDHLFPDWSSNALGGQCNIDAPLNPNGQGLLKGVSRSSYRPPAPGLQINFQGDLAYPQFRHALVRDNKVYDDSLLNLPSLSDLANPRTWAAKWGMAALEAMKLDMERIVTHKLAEHYSENRWDLPSFPSTQQDGGMPDHFDEIQPFNNTLYPTSNTLDGAAVLHAAFHNMNY